MSKIVIPIIYNYFVGCLGSTKVKKFSLKNQWLLNAEVSYNIQQCKNREDKMLYAYKTMNIMRENDQLEDVISILQDNLSEKDFTIVMAETNYGEFDNITFWVNKTIEDIISYYRREIHFNSKKLVIDKLKGAMCIFIEVYVAQRSEQATFALCDKIIATEELDFLHELAFYEKNNFENWFEDEEHTEDEQYLDLLDLEFYPDSLLIEYIEADSDDSREEALTQKQRKRQRNIVSSQLTFKHLLEV